MTKKSPRPLTNYFLVINLQYLTSESLVAQLLSVDGSQLAKLMVFSPASRKIFISDNVIFDESFLPPSLPLGNSTKIVWLYSQFLATFQMSQRASSILAQ
jgi:hypothetical protein